MTLPALLAILCRAFLSDTLQVEDQVEMHYVRTLSTTPLNIEGPEDAGGGRGLFQLPQEEQSLLGPLNNLLGVLNLTQLL